jgi:alcohol dehydrogenase
VRAIVVDAVRAVPEVREVADPVAPAGGVVVRVEATGMCRSDWHAWAGHDDDIVWPHVPGHELAGVVVQVGAGVERWRAGDRVAVPFVCGCGRCEWCLAGDAQVCPDQEQPGFSHWGSFAEHVVLHAADHNLVALPDQVDVATAAALGCRFATAYRALVGRARVAAGEWVAVVGAGGVGLSAVMIARALDARVVAVDRNPAALAAAAELGAEHTLLADGTDVPGAVIELTAGGSHVSIDAVGSEQTCADAILSARGRSPAGADGARHRLGARPARQPRHGGRRLPGDAGPHRAGRATSRSAHRADHRARRGRPAAPGLRPGHGRRHHDRRSRPLSPRPPTTVRVGPPG